MIPVTGFQWSPNFFDHIHSISKIKLVHVSQYICMITDYIYMYCCITVYFLKHIQRHKGKKYSYRSYIEVTIDLSSTGVSIEVPYK